MKTIHTHVAGILSLLLFISCTENSILLEYALKQAGPNRIELQKVLNHYQESDEEKYRAACFLIKNMPFYGSYMEGNELDKYLRYFKVYATNNNKNVQEIVDSLKQTDGEFHLYSLTKRKDITEIDSAFLTNHIDWAFKVWREQPWGKNVPFDDFCEYILPYRVMDEPLTLWRESLYNQYNPLLDSLRNTTTADDPLQAAQVVLKELSKQKYVAVSIFPEGPHVGPQILQWKIGDCKDLADALVYVCRALGIPCGVDYVLIWGDSNGKHIWNFIR